MAFEDRVRLNLMQARLLADYANRAEWHGSRGHHDACISYVQKMAEVLKGVRTPTDEEDPEGDVVMLMLAASAALKGGHPETKLMRDRSLSALERLERSFYAELKS